MKPSKRQLHRNMLRGLLQLRAQSYRQDILTTKPKITQPLSTMLSIGAQSVIPSKVFAFIAQRVLHKKSKHPLFWRLLVLGLGGLAGLWCKSHKNPH